MIQRHFEDRPRHTIGYRLSNSIDPFGRVKKRFPLSNEDTRGEPSLLEQIPYTQEPSFQSRARSLAGQLLFFCTISARFNVSAPETHLLPQYSGRAQHILDRRGVLSGYVIFDRGPHDLTGDEAFEIIAISDSKSPEWTEEIYNEAVERAQIVDKSAYKRESSFDLDLGPDGEDIPSWNLYNVIFIRSQEGIAERTGIGKLYKRAIAHSLDPGPSWKPIFLA